MGGFSFRVIRYEDRPTAFLLSASRSFHKYDMERAGLFIYTASIGEDPLGGEGSELEASVLNLVLFLQHIIVVDFLSFFGRI